MRSLVQLILVVAALQVAPPMLVAADPHPNELPPPNLFINEQSAAAAMQAGISAETLDAVAKAIQEFGVSFDLGDEKRYRAALTGPPVLMELAVAALQSEQAQRAANQLAREKLTDVPRQPGTTQPSQREPYPRTEYHRRVLQERIVVKGDNQRVTINRPPDVTPAYIAEKTPDGWRILLTDDDLRGAPPDKAAAAMKEQRQQFEQLRQQVAAGQLKSWNEYSAATSAIRRKFREQLKPPAGATTAPAAR
jgi:hypothetical protein